MERLSTASSVDAITETVAHAARELAGADGATFVLRDEDECFYADENAISPLWKGKRFPIQLCVSGWCMLHREVVLIPDIYRDDRVPKDAYRPTFVKSLCMVPIREAAPIGAIGAYWAEVHEPTPEEIKFLRILANTSATALENLELKRTLSHRNEERDDLTKRHRDFEFQLHSLAHDLKSPLATMIGFADLLQSRLERHEGLSAEIGYAETILRVGERLSRQIEKILHLYRITNQTLQLQPVDISAVARQLVQELSSQEPDRRVNAEVIPNLKAYGDPDLLRLALENLISNAFKYSRQKRETWIRIGCASTATDPNLDEFVVEDHGAGFDPAQAHRLFQPLVRLHHEKDFPGTGLGLASVARIVEMHGGTIRAEGYPGQGAKFSFTLARKET